MIRKRTRFDAMAPVAEVTWLVVADQYGDSLYVRELPPLTDPRMVMIEAMARSIRKGFEDEERRSVSIVRKAPTSPRSRPNRRELPTD